MEFIAGESPEQQIRILHLDFQQSGIRGKFTFSRDGSKAPRSARLYDMLVVECGWGPNLIAVKCGRGPVLLILLEHRYVTVW